MQGGKPTSTVKGEYRAHPPTGHSLYSITTRLREAFMARLGMLPRAHRSCPAVDGDTTSNSLNCTAPTRRAPAPHVMTLS